MLNIKENKWSFKDACKTKLSLQQLHLPKKFYWISENQNYEFNQIKYIKRKFGKIVGWIYYVEYKATEKNIREPIFWFKNQTIEDIEKNIVQYVSDGILSIINE